jgi:hypothetical protein
LAGFCTVARRLPTTQKNEYPKRVQTRDTSILKLYAATLIGFVYLYLFSSYTLKCFRSKVYEDSDNDYFTGLVEVLGLNSGPFLDIKKT